MAEIAYWLKGSSELNFGDYLSEYLLNHLFLQTARRPVEIRLIGSVLHDSFVPGDIASDPTMFERSGEPAPIDERRERLIAWGCGIRERGGLSPEHRSLIRVLSVRGPVSARDLALGQDIPQGDPAFLLPALYKPRHQDEFAHKAVCIPHFHDRRTDRDLLHHSACEVVLRPNIPYGEQNIEQFIDSVASARFVLSASLHGAIVAAAYGRPFTFWDPGVIDLPAKWEDLAASIGISHDFVRDLPSGLRHYTAHIAPHIRIPSLWTSLAVSPYPLRPDALLKVLRHELGPIEDVELDNMLGSRIAVFEAQRSHFDGIAGESTAEVSAALRTLAERNRQLATITLELELARKRNSALVSRIRQVEAGMDLNQTALSTPSAPFLHHVQFGAPLGSDPHPLFDALWYLQQNPDVRDAGVNPLVHYLQSGAAEGRDPHPLFDTLWYLRQNPDVRDAGMNPLVHYLQSGAAEGRDPHPLFDGHYYREMYLHEGSATTNPLLHYVTLGAACGLQPNLAFDAKGYAYEHEDVRQFHNNALIHYVTIGRESGFQPHALFERDWYRAKNADVIPSGMDAYEHFVRDGLPEGRLGSPALGRTSDVRGPFPFMTPEGTPTVAIIVATHRNYFHTYRCLVSISRMTGSQIPYAVALADTHPDDPLARLLAEQFNVASIGDTSAHASTTDRNSAAALTRSEFLVFFENHAVATLDWLAPMAEVARRNSRVGMVGGKHIYSNGKIMAAGGVIFRNGQIYPYGRGDDPHAPEYTYVRQVDCLMGGCSLIRRSAFTTLGGFDRRFSTPGYQDVDFALAVQQIGYSVHYQPTSEIYDPGAVSANADMTDRLSIDDHGTFRRKWAQTLERQVDSTRDLFIARETEHRAGTILVIDAQLEYDKNAGGLTTFMYIQLMLECGLKVIFIPHDKVALQPYTHVLQQLGVEVLYGTRDVAAWLDDVGRFIDCVWMARPHISVDYLHLVRSATSSRVIYYTHDLHFLREIRRSEIEKDPQARANGQRLKEIETDTFKAVDCVASPSTQEARVISALASDATVRVLPPHYFNESSSQSGSRAQKLERRREIVFVGSDHPPNVDAAVVLVQSVMPIVWQRVPDACVLIAGSIQHPVVRALQSSRVEVVGYVPDLQPYYDRARMSISPLRYGAGVKGKILSSLAAGVPVITTAIGNEGIELRDGIEVLLGETAERLAAHAVRLFSDTALLNRLAAAGRRVIAERYSKERALDALLNALNLQVCSMCGHSRPARVRVRATGAFACSRCDELTRRGRAH